jgi:hypothetical protein
MPNISGIISCSHTVVGSSKQIAASSLESCGLFRLISVIYHVTLLRLDVPHMTAKEIKGGNKQTRRTNTWYSIIVGILVQAYKLD